MNESIATATMTARCTARPETVYDLLSDLRTHLVWAGERQKSDYRLLTLESPPGVARVGTTFTSTGKIPMSTSRWEDRSTVTVADAPTVFEFDTEGRVKGRRTMTSRWRSGYEIQPVSGGCVVTHRLALLSVENPVLRLRSPMRAFTFKFGIPMFSGRGLRNLLKLAEQHEREAAAAVPAGG
jgi:Polyketide cyclase / dehydrase and lipid transport